MLLSYCMEPQALNNHQLDLGHMMWLVSVAHDHHLAWKGVRDSEGNKWGGVVSCLSTSQSGWARKYNSRILHTQSEITDKHSTMLNVSACLAVVERNYLSTLRCLMQKKAYCHIPVSICLFPRYSALAANSCRPLANCNLAFTNVYRNIAVQRNTVTRLMFLAASTRVQTHLVYELNFTEKLSGASGPCILWELQWTGASSCCSMLDLLLRNVGDCALKSVEHLAVGSYLFLETLLVSLERSTQRRWGWVKPALKYQFESFCQWPFYRCSNV